MIFKIIEIFIYIIAFLSILGGIIFQEKIYITIFIISFFIITSKKIYFVINREIRKFKLNDVKRGYGYIMLPIKKTEVIYFNDILSKNIYGEEAELHNWNKEYKISVEYLINDDLYLLNTIFYASDIAINALEKLIKNNHLVTMKIWGSEIIKTKSFEFDIAELFMRMNIKGSPYQLVEKSISIDKVNNNYLQ